VWCTQAAFGITVANGSTLYISDWQNGTISLYDALSDSLEIIVSEGVGHPAALFYSALTVLNNNGTLTRSMQHVCLMMSVCLPCLSVTVYTSIRLCTWPPITYVLYEYIWTKLTKRNHVSVVFDCNSCVLRLSEKTQLISRKQTHNRYSIGLMIVWAKSTSTEMSKKTFNIS